MKLELVLTYWQDGLFRSRERIEADSLDSLEEQFEFVMTNLKEMINSDNMPKDFGDDDIPF